MFLFWHFSGMVKFQELFDAYCKMAPTISVALYKVRGYIAVVFNYWGHT